MSHVKQPSDGTPRLRKVRSDSVLHALPEAKQLEIVDRLNRASAEAVSQQLREESPPIVVSSGPLLRFSAHWRAQQRFYRAQGYREAVMAQLAERHPDLDLGKLAEWGDALFLHTALATEDLEGYTRLRAVMERAKQTQLDSRRLEMLETKERKLAEVEKALQDRKAAGGLSPETLEQMESLLGMLQS